MDLTVATRLKVKQMHPLTAWQENMVACLSVKWPLPVQVGINSNRQSGERLQYTIFLNDKCGIMNSLPYSFITYCTYHF